MRVRKKALQGAKGYVSGEVMIPCDSESFSRSSSQVALLTGDALCMNMRSELLVAMLCFFFFTFGRYQDKRWWKKKKST